MLHKIVEKKKEEVTLLKRTNSIQLYKENIDRLQPTRNFILALKHSHLTLGLIAEVKKASPSKGMIRPDFDPLTIASEYEAGGADTLSVLTDESFFQGSLKYLTIVKSKVNLPILRKDFILDELQIYQSRVAGADAILLIAAILTEQQITAFHECAYRLDMNVLVEIHDFDDLNKVRTLKPPLIGINNRDLRTFRTDLKTTERLRSHIDWECLVVSESGISIRQDIDTVKEYGVNAVLIGEHFMRQNNIPDAVRSLMKTDEGLKK